MIRTVLEHVAALKRRLVPHGDIAERTVKSGIWVFGMNVFDRVLKLLMFVFIARLVGPREMGLLGIALLSLSALRRFSNLGIRTALIQRKDDDVDRYLDTAFSLAFLRGLLMMCLLMVLAPYIASFFGEPRVTNLIRVIGLTPVILGLRNPGMVYFKKDLELHKEFGYRISGTVTNVCVTVGYALIDASVWAFIFGHVADAVTRTLVTYSIHPYRPWPKLVRWQVAEIVGYGKWITGSSVLGFLYGQGDDSVVGWLLAATSLGYYQMAYRLSNAPATEVSNVISNVMFPAYSKLQDDPRLLREAVFKTLRFTSFIAFPMSFGIVAVAPTFVEAFLGPDWLPMVTVMQILVIYGLLRALLASFEPVWMAVGRPDIVTKLKTVQVVLLAILIVPVTRRYGIEGTAALVSGIIAVPILPVSVRVLVRTIDTTYWQLSKTVGYSFAASAIMSATVLSLRNAIDLGSPVLEFVLLVVSGVLVYVAAVAVLVVFFGWQIKRNLESVVNTVRN